ncbi:hypothetical protein DPMN_084130 [Dreissena polymorpha]|uniref:Uncharacterized protein n=1 Tax=Dreissena polymorpha TaxID=45954 RepID=A0A9D4BJ36_DREPO|nr:hypothetical protein DPMN_084130 [Dreissena polymorpha]
MRTRKQNSKPDRSGPVITTTAISTASLQAGCEKLTSGAQPSIKYSTKGTAL